MPSAIQVQEDHLCVISDLHMGNPIFRKNHSLANFLGHLAQNGTSLCVNGDGMDLLQFSIPKFAKDILETFKSIKDFFRSGTNEMYYVLGNHDVFLKTFLEDSGIFPVVSSLEVVSGDKRIHIEHGHLHDYLFRNYPKIYIKMARFFGKFIKIYPELFYLYFKIEWLMDCLAFGFKNKKFRGYAASAEQSPKHLRAAREILSRGFDIVIFGHSHRHGLHVLEDGKIFANAGTWTTRRSHFLEICKGSISLKEWD